MKVNFNATLEANHPLFEAFFSHCHSPLDHGMTTTFPRPAKPTNTNNAATATTNSSHPSPTLLPSHIITYLRSPIPSYITMKRENLTLDDKMPDQTEQRK